ncbi:hypothetical protein J2X65_003486 [Ancylobacter sp. 3268]|uniref:phage tail assembly protein n=1 Tax=Ancylobacter sp. 3268 TaxID=2817752 RepID=UPI002862DF0D|nr:phage tail assembly protein [Ancylobacter sp. 3268]MDR6954118.1 hypothetical protein [Ancylobacter sp. 3268]
MDQVTRALSQKEMDRLKPLPRFTGEGPARTLTVPLTFPVEYDGVVYKEVVIRRPTTGEWKAYVRRVEDAVRERGPAAEDEVDMSWLSVPAVVLNSLDLADGNRVEAGQEGFFAQSGLPDAAASQPTSTSEDGSR